MEVLANNIGKEAREYALSFSGVYRQNTAAYDFQAGFNKAQEWISVEDEMPQTGERVLVKCDGYWVNIGKYIDIAGTGETKPSFRWIVGNTNRNWNVTHWRKI